MLKQFFLLQDGFCNKITLNSDSNQTYLNKKKRSRDIWVLNHLSFKRNLDKIISIKNPDLII